METSRTPAHARAYRARRPERTVLYRALAHPFDRFLLAYEERFGPTHGYLRRCVEPAVHRYLDCGIFAQGVARIRCPDCRHEFLVAFSCKLRALCPSCHQKRELLWTSWAEQELLEDVPHRQVVFTIPKRLRIFFRYDRKLLGDLAVCAWRAIGGETVRNLLTWRHSGFSAHGDVRVKDRQGAARLGRYMIRCPLALKRLSWNEETAEVSYAARPTRRSGPRPTTASWDVLEFIARVVDHIPEPSQQMTRYWGFYANAARGKRHKAHKEAGARPAPAGDDAVDTFTRQARLSWAKLIKRVYEIDPLLCPFCGAEMKIVAFITDFATARAIRRSLKLPDQAPEPLAHGPPLELELLDQIA